MANVSASEWPTVCWCVLTISMALIMNKTGDMVAVCSKKFTGTLKMVETFINSLSDFKFRMEPLQMLFWRWWTMSIWRDTREKWHESTQYQCCDICHRNIQAQTKWKWLRILKHMHWNCPLSDSAGLAEGHSRGKSGSSTPRNPESLASQSRVTSGSTRTRNQDPSRHRRRRQYKTKNSYFCLQKFF